MIITLKSNEIKIYTRHFTVNKEAKYEIKEIFKKIVYLRYVFFCFLAYQKYLGLIIFFSTIQFDRVRITRFVIDGINVISFPRARILQVPTHTYKYNHLNYSRVFNYFD